MVVRYLARDPTALVHGVLHGRTDGLVPRLVTEALKLVAGRGLWLSRHGHPQAERPRRATEHVGSNPCRPRSGGILPDSGGSTFASPRDLARGEREGARMAQ